MKVPREQKPELSSRSATESTPTKFATEKRKKIKAKSKTELRPAPSRRARGDVKSHGKVKPSKAKRKSKADEPASPGNNLSEVEDIAELPNGDASGDAVSDWSDAEASTDGNGPLNDSHPDGNQDEGDAPSKVAEESDSSEDEVPDRNTVGDVPLEWYKEEEHIGYDMAGKKIKKQPKKDKIDSFLDGADDSKNWRKIYDEYNDEQIELTKTEVKMIKRMLQGRTPHSNVDPYEPYVDWFDYEDKDHPVSSAPEPKSRFIPSKHEHKKVVRYIRAIRKGWIKFDKPQEEEQKPYLLWNDDTAENEGHGPNYIPAPKQKRPGHEESYNPPVEYIPTEEEINSYLLMPEEDRPKFIPKRYESLRSIPAYSGFINEVFERCLDLYLCPRVRKKKLNIDPESLKPKLPNPNELKPYPSTCYLEYKGHTGPVTTISIDTTGQWIASGSNDGTARIWEIETGRCLKVWNIGEAVKHIAWNPSIELPIIALSVGEDVLILDTGLGRENQAERIQDLLHVDFKQKKAADDSADSVVSWHQHDTYMGVRLKHFKDVSSVEWHRKGDYFCTVVPRGDSRAILMHQLSKKQTKIYHKKLRGLPVSAVFHPAHSQLFVSTKRNVRVYDIVEQKLQKKLETGVREVSSLAIHPAGDNVIVGSREGKLCWFDMDLSTHHPYQTRKAHDKDINNVAFHNTYPLFASCSDDGSAFVFHGMVYADLNTNPLIVPLKILRGHKITGQRGVLDCKFHPKQPWLFTAGSDSLIKLYCN